MPFESIEAKRAYLKAYNEIYKEEIKAWRKDFYRANKERINAQNKANYQTHKKQILARHKEYIQEHKKEIVCIVCGNPARSSNDSKFCSDKCQGKWHSGPRASCWRGGISFKPYCPQFNESLKEEIRADVGRRCFLSGNKETGRKLAIHHCDYMKSQGCQGQRWSLLPLDHGWHSKTNNNRWYWFALLRDYWAYKYLTFHGMDIFEGPDRTTWLWEIYNRSDLT